MVGRRRRAPSNSTVATIDDSTMQYYKEDSVLKTASSKSHSDDWPCFLLTDATIYHKDGTLANLLHVDLEGPLIVRGQLQIEKDQERFLVNRQMRNRTPRIQVQSTQSFSVGLKDDRLPMPVLWASGGAGWFEIVPSDSYRTICDTMFQGISLHYAILDEYEAALEELHKKKKNKNKTLDDVKLPLDEVLFKYVITVGDGITLPEAHQRVEEQAIFLLSHFPQGTEFHNWLVNQFPDIARALAAKESKKSKETVASKSSPLIAIPYPALETSSSLEVTDSKKRGRPPLRNSASRSLRNSETVGSEKVESSGEEQVQELKPTKAKQTPLRKTRSGSIHTPDAMIIDTPDGNLNAATNNEKEQSVRRLPVGKPAPQANAQEINHLNQGTHSEASSSVTTVLEALEDSRNDMLELINEGKQKKHPDNVNPKTWFNKLYLQLSIKDPKALSEVCEYYAKDLTQLLGPEWHESELYKWLKENTNTMPRFEFTSEEDIKKLVRRRKKAKTSTTAMREEQQIPAVTQDLAVRTGGKQTPLSGRTGGKVAGLRPSTGSKKRLRHQANLGDDEMDTDEDGIFKKTSKRSRHFEEDEEHDEEADDTDSSLSDDEDEGNTDSPLTRIAIRAEKLPSSLPKGPNQTWTCEEPDCGYVVRAADEEEGKILIGQHFEGHERDAQEEAEQEGPNRDNLMDLALQESQKGHLPINHLLEKIRNMGHKAQNREAVRLNGELVPQPIKRGLPV
ncbi:hypothetical protein M426DRAFT_317664 [Hypoxylon sp. CI-4A]|nr:hypothetical protein M426DRAFT_317664 [Hypoxylon sp. CI-4A]